MFAVLPRSTGERLLLSQEQRCKKKGKVKGEITVCGQGNGGERTTHSTVLRDTANKEMAGCIMEQFDKGLSSGTP